MTRRTRQPGRITHVNLPTSAALGQALAEAILTSVNRQALRNSDKAANHSVTQDLTTAYTQLAGK